jgi:hypothetical protein
MSDKLLQSLANETLYQLSYTPQSYSEFNS